MVGMSLVGHRRFLLIGFVVLLGLLFSIKPVGAEEITGPSRELKDDGYYIRIVNLVISLSLLF